MLVAIYKILQEIREIAKNTKQATEWFLEDFDEMRESVREKGLRLRFFLNFFRGLFEIKERMRPQRKRRIVREVVDTSDEPLDE